MEPISKVTQTMVAKAHDAVVSLAVPFLPFQDVVSNTSEAYPTVQSPYWDHLLSAVTTIWQEYTAKARGVVASVLPPWYILIPLFLLSLPVRHLDLARSQLPTQ